MRHIVGIVADAQSISLPDKGADLIVAVVAAAIIAGIGLIAGSKGRTARESSSLVQQARAHNGVILQAGGHVSGNHIYNSHMSITHNATMNLGAETKSDGSKEWPWVMSAAGVAATAALFFISFSNLAFGLLIGAAAGGAVALITAIIRSVRLGVISDRRIARAIVVVLVLALECTAIVRFGLHDMVWAGQRLLDYQNLADSARGDGEYWSLQYLRRVVDALGGDDMWLGAVLITLVFLAALLTVFFAILQIVRWQNMLRLVSGTGSDRALARARSFASANVTSDVITVLMPLLLVGALLFVNASQRGGLPYVTG